VNARFRAAVTGVLTDLLADPIPVPAQAPLDPPRFELLSAAITAGGPLGATDEAVVLRDNAYRRDYPFRSTASAISAARSLQLRRARSDSFYGWRSDAPPPTVTFHPRPATPIYLEVS